MQVYDVAGYHIRGLVKALEALSINVDAVLREAQISREALDDPEARFAEPQMLSLWLAAERRWEKPEPFALMVPQKIPYGGLELIDYLIAACADVGEAIETSVRYASLCASGFHYTLEAREDGDASVMCLRLHHRYGIELIPPAVITYLWAALIWRFREYGNVPFRPELHLREPRPASHELYRRVLGDVRFGCAHNELHVPRDQWTIANPRRDPMLSTLLARHADDVLARSLPGTDFLSSVRVAIADAMRLGDLSVERAAKRLGLSERTLQRRLAEEGFVFKQLLDEVRYSFAVRYLSHTKLSLSEITDLLGYSEQRAFQRAFLRWSGKTPASYRRAHTAPLETVAPPPPLRAYAN